MADLDALKGAYPLVGCQSSTIFVCNFTIHLLALKNVYMKIYYQ